MASATRIDHVAIAVKDLDAAVRRYTDNFGFPVTKRTEAPAVNITLALLRIGDADLELFTPTSADSPPAKFLAERGEGMYVLSLEVDDLDAMVQRLRANGARVGDIGPSGDGHGRLAYVSPKSTHGVLLQLIEHGK